MVNSRRTILSGVDQIWYPPSIIRGAVQVGKSTLVRKFAESNDLILNEINLEQHLEIKGMNPRASSGLKRKLVSLAPLAPQQSCEEFFD